MVKNTSLEKWLCLLISENGNLTSEAISKKPLTKRMDETKQVLFLPLPWRWGFHFWLLACLSVYWFVSKRHYTKTTAQITMKFSGRICQERTYYILSAVSGQGADPGRFFHIVTQGIFQLRGQFMDLDKKQSDMFRRMIFMSVCNLV